MPSTPGFASRPARRNTLRVVGVVSVNSMEGPTRFWMFLLAMPFFVVGGASLQLGLPRCRGPLRRRRDDACGATIG